MKGLIKGKDSDLGSISKMSNKLIQMKGLYDKLSKLIPSKKKAYKQHSAI